MAPTEITRDQTRERAALLQVDSYEVRLDYTGGDQLFRSESVIRFSCREPGAASYADLIAEQVREITLNGTALDPATAYTGDRITLPGLAADNELRVVADCRYSSEGTGMHRTVDSADGKVYLYTKFEPAYARRVFANFEQPDLKSRFTFHVTVPESWTVLSNEPSPVTEPAGPSAVTWHFPPTPVISTYLTAVVAGEYEVVRAEHTTPAGQQIPLTLACRASLAAHLDAGDVLAITRQGLDFYTGLFRGSYPFAQYAQAFVPDYSAGATENVGCVAITDQMLFPYKVTDTMYELRAMMILHEMAHMWFGDLVTMRWWDDLWLNESFAELSATLSSAECTRFTGAWTTFSAIRKTWAYEQDQLPSTHPVAADVATLSQAVANFDGISYAKGASVLQQLCALVGRDNFFAGIRAYFAEHAFGNATLADLLHALEASSGQSLADWSRAWLQTAGPSLLRAVLETGPDGRITSFAIAQEALSGHPEPRPHHIAVGLYDRGAGGLERVQRVEVDVTGPRTEVPALAGQPQPDLILINDGDLGYAVIRFDQRSLRTVTESVSQLSDSLARSVCWTALIDMARQAELPPAEFARVVASQMGSEPVINLVQVMHYVADQIVRLASPEDAARCTTELAAAAARLLNSAVPGSDHQLAWAQLLSWSATSPDQLDLLSGLLEGSVTVAGLAVDTDLRWVMLQRLASTGRAGDAEIDAELARDPSSAGQRHAHGCRAAIPDAAHKAAAWQLLVHSDELGTHGTPEVARAFAQPGHADLVAPYAERYFEELPGIWASRGEHFRALLARVLFPATAASEELVARVGEFLASERDPALVRLLVEQRDAVQRALRSRSQEGSAAPVAG
ncbi:MAG TPA: aminopeptidase N [Streptosporangiaceae bacterium]|nr:aminopeptidase N [Streptosporangiaceae bacterium]